MSYVYAVIGEDIGIAHVFSKKENAERYVSVTDADYFTIVPWELDDDKIDILAKQYVYAHILWDNEKVEDIQVNLESYEINTIKGIEYGHGDMLGEYWIIQCSKEYNGEDMDILKESFKTMLCYLMEEVKDMTKQGISDEKIEEMLATHTPEEWHKFIDEEMERLGLEFVEETEFDKNLLFDVDVSPEENK